MGGRAFDIWLYIDTAIKQLRPVQASIRRWPVDCCWNYMLQNLFLF